MSNLSVPTVITLESSLENIAQVTASVCLFAISHTNLPDLESQILAEMSLEELINHLSSVLVQFKEFIYF